MRPTPLQPHRSTTPSPRHVARRRAAALRKKAHHKMSLKWHPEKNIEHAEAKETRFSYARSDRGEGQVSEDSRKMLKPGAMVSRLGNTTLKRIPHRTRRTLQFRALPPDPANHVRQKTFRGFSVSDHAAASKPKSALQFKGLRGRECIHESVHFDRASFYGSLLLRPKKQDYDIHSDSF